MKKILLAASALALSTSLFASGNHMNLYGGTSQIEDSDKGYALGVGYDIVGTTKSGLELGVGIDTLYTTSDYEDGALSVDLGLVLGYTKNDFAVRTSLGYGIGTISDNTLSGLVYSVGGEYDFTKNFGVGVKYKVQDFDMEILNYDVPANTKNILMYIYFSK